MERHASAARFWRCRNAGLPTPHERFVMRGFFALTLFGLVAFPTLAQEKEIGLRDIPALVRANDLAIDTSAQLAQLAWNKYRSVLSQGELQMDLMPGYKLQYTPMQEIQSFVATGSPPSLSVEDQTNYNQGTSDFSARLSLSQLLPTAGVLSLSLEHVMSVYTSSSQQIVSLGPTTSSLSPSPQFGQKPRISLTLDQPLFVNGKVIDLDLFPATLQKARIGYEKATFDARAQDNRTLFQAVQYFLQIVQLRKAVGQAEKSLAVSQGNLETTEKNFSLGSVAEAKVLDARIALSNQKVELLELRAALSRTERALAHSVGRESFEGVPFAEEIPVLDFTMQKEEALARAMSSHPLVQKTALDTEEQKVSDVLAGRSYASDLSLSFSLSPRYPLVSTTTPYMTDFLGSFSDLFSTGSSADFAFSANLRVRLLDGERQAADKSASAASIRIAQDSLLAQRQAIREDVERGFLQKTNLQEKILMLEEAVTLAGKRLDAESMLRDLGKSTSLGVDARLADYDLKVNELWKARADLFLMIVDLHSLLGDDLAPIIRGLT